MKYSLKQLLTESMTRQAWEYFNGAFGFETMMRREVPSKELMSSNRDVYYGKFSQGGCDTLFQLEQTEIYDIVNDKPIDVIWIHGIRTLGDCQGKGGGTHVMNCIMDFADTIGLGVAGSVVPYGSSKMTREQMMAFDGRFGLKPLSYWRQFLPRHVLEDEDAMWEIDDYISSNQDQVWRPAGGAI
jgi:hypothetical protein